MSTPRHLGLLQVESLEDADRKIDGLANSGQLNPALLLTMAKAYSAAKDTDITKEEVKEIMGHLYFKARPGCLTAIGMHHWWRCTHAVACKDGSAGRSAHNLERMCRMSIPHAHCLGKLRRVPCDAASRDSNRPAGWV